MKCAWILPVIGLTAAACATPKAVESTARAERRDTLRAVLAEELKVRFDDVVIIPPDSMRPRIAAARVELRRDRETTLSRRVEESAEATAAETPSPPQSSNRRLPLWVALIVAAGAYIAGARRRN